MMGAMRRIFAPALVSFTLMTSSSYSVSALVVAVTRLWHATFSAIFPVPQEKPSRCGGSTGEQSDRPSQACEGSWEWPASSRDGARHRWRIDGCGVVGPRSSYAGQNEAPRCKRGLRGLLCLHLRGQANQTTEAKSWRTSNGGRIRYRLSVVLQGSLSFGSLVAASPLLQSSGTSAMRSATASRERLHYS
jgi:hypothetical protein